MIINLISFIIFISTSVEVYSLTTHALIGTYDEIDSEFCGYSKPSLVDINARECLKWHQNSGESLKNSRNVTAAEAPWTVLITHNLTRFGKDVPELCTGTIIAPGWILTTAHCAGDYANEYRVYIGYDFNADQAYFNDKNYFLARRAQMHGDFMGEITDDMQHDIGIIQLLTNISLIPETDGNYYRYNSICLPQKDIKNSGKEYVLTTGWGATAKYGRPLQIGYRIIGDGDEWMEHESVKARTCKGDGGAPLWQYDDGRAVLVGIHSCNVVDGSKCTRKCTGRPNTGYAVRVSKYIPWILEYIKTHPSVAYPWYG